MTGHGIFKYYVNFAHNFEQEFCDVRKWCWGQWGASDDYEFLPVIKGPNIAWCWLNDKYTMRIYLASDKEAQWFTLRWV